MACFTVVLLVLNFLQKGLSLALKSNILVIVSLCNIVIALISSGEKSVI